MSAETNITQGRIGPGAANLDELPGALTYLKTTADTAKSTADTAKSTADQAAEDAAAALEAAEGATGVELDSSTTPSAVTSVGSPGVSTKASPADHAHALPNTVPQITQPAAPGLVYSAGAGTFGVKKWNDAATGDPGMTDDVNAGWAVGSLWINTTDGKVWMCTANTAATAVWKQLSNAA